MGSGVEQGEAVRFHKVFGFHFSGMGRLLPAYAVPQGSVLVSNGEGHRNHLQGLRGHPVSFHGSCAQLGQGGNFPTKRAFGSFLP